MKSRPFVSFSLKVASGYDIHYLEKVKKLFKSKEVEAKGIGLKCAGVTPGWAKN